MGGGGPQVGGLDTEKLETCHLQGLIIIHMHKTSWLVSLTQTNKHSNVTGTGARSQVQTFVHMTIHATVVGTTNLEGSQLHGPKICYWQGTVSAHKVLHIACMHVYNCAALHTWFFTSHIHKCIAYKHVVFRSHAQLHPSWLSQENHTPLHTASRHGISSTTEGYRHHGVMVISAVQLLGSMGDTPSGSLTPIFVLTILTCGLRLCLWKLLIIYTNSDKVQLPL